MNIGAGRVVAMDLGQIDLAIEDGSYRDTAALNQLVGGLSMTGGTAHLFGLISDGGVHAQLDHLIETTRYIAGKGVRVLIHAITDGRDVAPKSALGYLDTLQKALPDNAGIATLSGRYFAMDRDNRWDRVAQAYDAITHGKGEKFDTAAEAIKASYDKGVTDEFIKPAVIGRFNGIGDNDGFFCLNFRADRAREILRALGEPGFAEFDIGIRPHLARLLGMVEYSDDHNAYMTTVFPKKDITNTLAEWVAKHGRKQFHIAETEKYPHVTFFFNGGKEDPADGEIRYMAASPKVATYDLQPEMSAPEVTEHLVAAIHADYDLIVVNYANPDMVGHTGDLAAAIKACEAVDAGLGQALDAVKQVGGAMIVTADHGNCETMVDTETGEPHTAHTTNLVPVIVVGADGVTGLNDGRLADLAPSLLDLMELEGPMEMTGKSLLIR